MNRRNFSTALAATLAAAAPWPAGAQAASPWPAIERRSGGRMGIAVLQADGSLQGHRLEERFPMCSTFKWLAAACVLQRVDQGRERLDRRIPFGRDVLLPHSPVTSRYVGAGMTLGELCRATIVTSDNAAGNLVLESVGGPRGLTAYARSLGDEVTRLDRMEPELNDVPEGDARDTTSPRAMAMLLHKHLLGDALSPAGRALLATWLEATETNDKRLRADLPAGWRMGSKTGTSRVCANDAGIFWPPGRPPVIVAAYVTATRAPDAERNGAIADVARWVTSR